MPCWIKWVVSVVAGSGSVILGIAAGMAIVIGGAYGFEKAVHAVIPAERRTAISRAVGNWPSIIVGSCIAVGVMWAFGLGFMESYFGCDSCLPESMQTNCKTFSTDQEARDRATYEGWREKYGWTDCDVSPGAK